MHRVAFSPVLSCFPRMRKHTGCLLDSIFLPRNLIYPTTYPASMHMRTQIRATSSAHANTSITPIGTEIIGQSGSQYVIERLLQEKEIPGIRVYLAKNGTERFILKNVHDFDYYHDIYRRLSSSPCLRLLHDIVPSQSIFVYEYLIDNLLDMAKKDIPIIAIKRILRDALRGLKALHDQSIVHTDIKANNIMIDWEEKNGEIIINRVQLADLEDSAIIPSNCDILGKAVGNWMWRSPEAHAEARVNTPSDIFSFGIVCICAVIKHVILAVDANTLPEGVDVQAIVLQRQLSYFGNDESIAAFLKHLGDENPWCTVINILWNGFDEVTPREPFALWKGVDPAFKDLIAGLTDIDPKKRLTAQDALEHPWFQFKE